MRHNRSKEYNLFYSTSRLLSIDVCYNSYLIRVYQNSNLKFFSGWKKILITSESSVVVVKAPTFWKGRRSKRMMAWVTRNTGDTDLFGRPRASHLSASDLLTSAQVTDVPLVFPLLTAQNISLPLTEDFFFWFTIQPKWFIFHSIDLLSVWDRPAGFWLTRSTCIATGFDHGQSD